ncbi:hypothetical protein [Ketobacter sp.]|uniref:hypothetical protein n=1 Tax=Ketobacter sp. TaxID=2083498 RepID=UPI0025C347B0|nr:hypothetical protein [Ketobacter sp.]
MTAATVAKPNPIEKETVMKSITDALIMTLSGFITFLTVGKFYDWTKDWIAGLVAVDYGEFWIPVVLFLWFLVLLVFLFTCCAYALNKLEIIMSGKLINLIRFGRE